MKIILMETTNLIPFIIPYVPTNTRLSLNNNGVNSEINTINGRIRTFGNRALRKLKWSSFFPVDKDYNFVKRNSLRNGWVYVNFLEQMKTARLPIRTIITTEDERTVVFNRLTTISQFNYFVDNVEDVNYTLRLVEFIR